ncbi:nucleotidyltransferase [Spirochaetia bacterium]|nr:nucleotidyltransferase [Spirochaetia bacterium]
MNTNKIDITVLKNAVGSLERTITVINRKEQEDTIPADERETLQGGVIQAFEYTYELCWRFMKRWLDYNYSKDRTFGITRKELFRLAAENALIADVVPWFDFHDARNKTSHEYGGEIAKDVYRVAKEFLPYAKDFVSRLEVRL